MPLQHDNLTYVVMVDKDIPSDHSFIQGIFEKVLPGNNQHIIFIGYGNVPNEQREHIEYVFVKPWSSYFIVKKIQKLFSFTYKLYQRRSKIDVLYTRNDPMYLIVGTIFKLFFRGKVHFHQVSHLHAYSSNLIRSSAKFRIKSYGDRLIRFLTLHYVDQILVISDAMKEFLNTRWATHKDKLKTYPLGVLREDFANDIPFNNRSIDLAYIGTLAKSRELTVIVDAIDLYSTKYGGQIKLHIWGQSHDRKDDNQLLEYIHNKKLESRVIFHGKVPRSKILQVLPDVKIGLSTIPPKGLLKQISPTKLMEYMAAGCQVVATHGIPEQEMIINEAGFGKLVDFTPEAIAKGIHEVFEAHNPIDDSKGKNYILEKRAYEKMGIELMNDVQRLIGR